MQPLEEEEASWTWVARSDRGRRRGPGPRRPRSRSVVAMRPSPSKPALGRAVAELRRQRGLTQGELAHGTGLHRAYIAGIENGKRNPTWQSVGTLALGLHVALSE